MAISEYQKWLKSAQGNLLRGDESNYSSNLDLPMELICFDLQQCVEKSLKSIFILHQEDFLYTHDLGLLVKNIEKTLKIHVPDYVKECTWMSKYAFKTRYPGDWEPISTEEYQEALMLAEKVYQWAKDIGK